jgi:manganese/zinc/iron transport system substrate-binding protein
MRRHFFFLLIALISCSAPEEDDRSILIVTTTSMIADGVSAMVDTFEVEVTSLMGPGTDPHLFKPTKTTLDLLGEADIVVANGLHLEGRMQDILEKMSRKKKVIFVGDGIAGDDLIHPEGKTGFPDPHVWFDLSLWKQGLIHVAEELETEGVLRKEASRSYLSFLDSLHLRVQEDLREIPEENRVLITAHDAFSYFGRAYGIEVIGLQGISTVAEYGIRDVQAMVDLIIDREVKAVFVESSISPRAMEAVVSGVEQRGGEVKIGGTLYSDAPGSPGSGASDFAGMVEHNVLTIKEALK